MMPKPHHSPAPCPIGQFHWDRTERRFTGEISSTYGFGRVWNDACDEGLTVVNPKTGGQCVFVVERIIKRDGEIVAWELAPVTPLMRDRVRGMTLFND